MTIYKYSFDQVNLKVKKTTYSNVEFLGNSSFLMYGVRSLCNENDLETFKNQVMFSVYGDKENEFLAIIIEQKKRRMQELLKEYHTLEKAINVIEKGN